MSTADGAITNKERGKVFRAQRDRILNGAGLTVRLYIMRPDLKTHINIDPGTDVVQVEITTDIFKEDGNIITAYNDADVIWAEKHNATGIYNEGRTSGITCIRVTSTPVANDIDISVSQTEGR